jgi:hypothetical protein
MKVQHGSIELKFHKYILRQTAVKNIRVVLPRSAAYNNHLGLTAKIQSEFCPPQTKTVSLFRHTYIPTHFNCLKPVVTVVGCIRYNIKISTKGSRHHTDSSINHRMNNIWQPNCSDHWSHTKLMEMI